MPKLKYLLNNNNNNLIWELFIERKIDNFIINISIIIIIIKEFVLIWELSFR